MPSRIRRRSAAGTWIDVADFDAMTLAPNTAWGMWKRGTFVGSAHYDIPASGQPFSVQDICSMTTTLVANRMYRMTLFLRAFAPTDGSGAVAAYHRVKKNGTIVAALGDPWIRSGENYDSYSIEWIFPTAHIGTTADTVISIEVSNGTGEGLRLWMDAASYFVLEDVGPDRG